MIFDGFTSQNKRHVKTPNQIFFPTYLLWDFSKCAATCFIFQDYCSLLHNKIGHDININPIKYLRDEMILKIWSKIWQKPPFREI